MRLAPLALVLLFASSAAAQTFRPAGGPWTRNHTLVGSAPDGRIFATSGTRLGVTADGGATWTVVSETVAPRRLAAAGGVLLGAFSDGVRRSTDGGATWMPFGLDGQNVQDVAIGAETYAVTPATVYRLVDLAVWLPVALPSGLPGNAEIERVVASGAVVAVYADNEPNCDASILRPFVARSLNAGATWTTYETGINGSALAIGPDGSVWSAGPRATYCSGYIFNGQLRRLAPNQSEAAFVASGDFTGLAVGSNGVPVYASGSYLYGQSGWSGIANGPAVIGDVFSFGTDFLVGSVDRRQCGLDPPCSNVSGSGLYRIRDGRAVSVGFERSIVRALTTFGDTVIAAADGSVVSGGAEWRSVANIGEVRDFVSLIPSDALLAVSAGRPFPPFVAFGQGSGFGTAVIGGDPNQSPQESFLDIVSSDLVAGNLIFAASHVYERSGVYTNNALVLSYSGLGSVEGVEGSVVYAGVRDSLWVRGTTAPPPARIFRSGNAGETWAPDDAGMTARNVYAFDAIGTGAARLDLAGTSRGVFARTPGQPWQPDGLADRTVYTLYTAPAGLLAGTDDGLFLRDAAGAWARYGAGLDGRTVYAVLATDNAFGPWLGVGTDAGLFETRPFGVGADAPAAPVAARLAVTTVPNPSRGFRMVRVVGLADAAASVSVFDLLGRRVADLGTHEARPGARLDVSWDASALPAGVYVVRVRSGGDVATVRAVVTR